MTMQYQEAVQEARRLVKRSEDDQWRLAQLTYEQVETGITRVQWAQDIGVSSRSVTSYYRIWERFGSTTGSDRPRFTDAWVEERDPQRAEAAAQGMSRYGTDIERGVRNLPPERKAEVARELLQDLPTQTKADLTRQFLAEPQVAEAALRDDETSVNVAMARGKHVQERNQRQDEAARMRAPQLYEDADVLAAQNSLGHVVEYLELAIKQISRVPEHRRAEFFPRLVAEIDRLSGWLHSVVDGQSLDEGIAKLLEGGER
jgi:hypothetical protein